MAPWPRVTVPGDAISGHYVFACWFALTVALIAGFVAHWWSLGVPYRFFPSDDKAFYWTSLQSELFAPLYRPHQPFVGMVLCLFGNLYRLFAPLSESAFSILSIGCYAITMFFLSLMAYKSTGSLVASGLVLVLFGTSAWPTTYLEFWYCCPITVAVGSVCLFSVLEASWQSSDRFLAAFVAGITAGMCLGCEVAAIIFITLCAAWMAVASRPIENRDNQLTLVIFLFALSIGYLMFLHGNVSEWIRHIADNESSGHNAAAISKFQASPRRPVFTGLWILWLYNPVLTLVFLASTVGLCRLLIMRFGGRRRLFTPAEKLMVAMGLFAWAYLLIIDVLPTTKLGRSYFIGFPVLCLFVALAIQQMAGWIRPKWKLYYAGVVGILLIPIVLQGIRTSREMRYRRHALPRYLAQHIGSKKLFLIKNDPHAGELRDWLSSDRQCELISLDDFNAERIRLNNQAVLLCGPTGRSSGNSILAHGCKPDFVFDCAAYADQTGAHRTTLPYYAYYPLFCLEEENCQGLLYEGRIPSDRDPTSPSGLDPQKNVTLFVWGPGG